MLNKYLLYLATIMVFSFSFPIFATKIPNDGDILESNQSAYIIPTLKELALLNILNACSYEDFEPYAQELAIGLPTRFIDEARQILQPSNYDALVQYNSTGLLTGNVFKSFKNALRHSNDCYTIAINGQSIEKITSLKLYNKGIAIFPQAIKKMTKLEMLYLSYNQLTTLPAEIRQLTSLKFLLLENNQLIFLPAEVEKLTRLSKLYLRGNPLEYLPLSIRNMGPQIHSMLQEQGKKAC